MLVSSAPLQEVVCLLGQPVAGNPTQFMMERAFERAGLDWRFLTCEVAADQLPAALAGAGALGFRGVLLAPPHHVAAATQVVPLSSAAQVSGVVTLLSREQGALSGDNLLASGALAVLKRAVDPAGKRVVLLGAGGSAASIASALLPQGIAALTIVNRTLAHADQLAERLRSVPSNQEQPPTIETHEWKGEFAIPAEAEIVVHATSLNQTDLSTRVPVKWPASNSLTVLDISINPVEPRIMREAKERQFTRVTGLAVFVEHAALAFERLTQLPADRALLQDAVEEFFG